MGIFLILKSEIAGSIFSQHFVVGFFPEHAMPEKENMENNSDTKHIANGGILLVHVFDVDDLWGHIARSPTTHKQIRLAVRIFWQPEVGYN